MSTIKTTKTAKVETKAADKEKAVVETVKAPAKTEPVKAATAKTAVKTEEAKAAPKPAAKKTTKPAAKTTTAKKTTTKKTTATKTTTAKKAPAKRAAKAAAEIYIEYAGSQQSTADITARVVEATGKKASAIKVLNIYVQPETGKIYYTADGTNGEIAY